MICKEIFCALPIDADPINEIEEDLLETLLEDTCIIYSDCLKDILEYIKDDFSFKKTGGKPIKVKITIKVEELIKE